MNKIRKISRCSGCGRDRAMCVSVDAMNFYCNRCGKYFGLGLGRERLYDDTAKDPNVTKERLFDIKESPVNKELDKQFEDRVNEILNKRNQRFYSQNDKKQDNPVVSDPVVPKKKGGRPRKIVRE